MSEIASACDRRFNFDDFDEHRLDLGQCPVRDCAAELIDIPVGKTKKPWCPAHGIRLHTNTFVYWNGQQRIDESKLRNFIVRPDLVRAIALRKGMKVESHRLGYEMSEDALSWNVFVSLAAAGRLRAAAEFLTSRSLRTEPDLYLWGRRIDLRGGSDVLFAPLQKSRDDLEKGIHPFVTEPDIMLVADGEILICIEAKFGAANPLAHDSKLKAGDKPTARDGLLQRYLGDKTSARTKAVVRAERIGPHPRSQLLRNVVFASEMAGDTPWHVVNLVSATLSVGGRDDPTESYADPSNEVRGYLREDHQHCFTYRSWEGLHANVVKDQANLTALDQYLRGKSAHYRPAFELR